MRISDWSSDVCSSDLSGGAKVAQRYALLARGQTRIAPRFVIANPSSYAYFDAQRPMAFDPASCPGFNHWKYGLQNLPAYAAGQTPVQQIGRASCRERVCQNV